MRVARSSSSSSTQHVNNMSIAHRQGTNCSLCLCDKTFSLFAFIYVLANLYTHYTHTRSSTSYSVSLLKSQMAKWSAMAGHIQNVRWGDVCVCVVCVRPNGTKSNIIYLNTRPSWKDAALTHTHRHMSAYICTNAFTRHGRLPLAQHLKNIRPRIENLMYNFMCVPIVH